MSVSDQRRADIRRRKLVGFATMAALALMLGAVVANAFNAAAQRRTAEAWHVHSLDVLLDVGAVRTAVHAALRGERGYMLTGDRTFLQPYVEGRRDSLALLPRLRALTADNPVQRANLDRFEPRLHAYLAVLERMIALKTAGREAEAIVQIRAGIGRRHITDLLNVLDRVEREERRLLAQRRAADEAAGARTDLYNYGFAAVGVLLIGLLGTAAASAAKAHRRSLELAEEFERHATTDVLTGLPNRRHLMEALEREIARAGRTGRPLTLAVLDADRFKRVNDSYGHPGGDAVLCAIAEVLREGTRAGDILGRLGGEEFAILMPETSYEEAMVACERIRHSVAKRPIPLPCGASAKVTISAGLALLAEGESSDRLLLRADVALYEAKEGGRNQVRLAA